METRGALALVACESGRPFAKRVLNSLNELVRKVNRTRYMIKESEEVWFANGEVKTIIHDNVRGDDLYIIQEMEDPNSERSINDNLMALMTAVHAAYQADADSITIVTPQFPYSRQERKKTREGITAKQVAQFMEISGANRVITLDIHAEAIQGFFNHAKMEDLHASRTIIEHLKSSYKLHNVVVVAPDVGGAERARFYSKELQADLAIVDKARNYSKASTIEAMRLVGDVNDRDVFLIDDMIATGGTLINACKLLKDKGARNIYCAASLTLLNGSAVEKFQQAFDEKIIKRVIGTDAVYRTEDFIKKNPWFEQVSIAPLFAQVIY
ncbi:MAG: ribose-phosphate pyrophosphokinase, partial [Calditrichaeota bacterium]|nr:ribose-phosphate pyrophosphokinase [Calditrichota bacterium]